MGEGDDEGLRRRCISPRADAILSASRLDEHVSHRCPLVTPTGHQPVEALRDGELREDVDVIASEPSCNRVKLKTELPSC